MKKWVLAILVGGLVGFYSYSAFIQKVGKDFPYGECVAAYDKFGSSKDILEKLKYKDMAKEEYSKYSKSPLAVNLAIMKDQAKFNNYLISRQYSRYISCVNGMKK